MSTLPRHLGRLRKVVEARLPDTCTIQSPTLTPDDQGGQLQGWMDAAVGVPCRVAPSDLSPVEQEIAGQLQSPLVIEFTMRHTQSVNETQRILYRSEVYHIISVERTSYQTAQRIRAAR